MSLAFTSETGCTNSIPGTCFTSYNSAAVDALTGMTYAAVGYNGSFSFARVEEADGKLALTFTEGYRLDGKSPRPTLAVIFRPGADFASIKEAPESGYEAVAGTKSTLHVGDVAICKLVQDGATTYGKVQPTAITKGTSTPSSNNGDNGALLLRLVWNKTGGRTFAE